MAFLTYKDKDGQPVRLTSKYKIHNINVSQDLGQSTADVMSQKAVSDQINLLLTKLNEIEERIDNLGVDPELAATVESLSTQVSTLNTQISGINTSVESQNTRLQDLESYNKVKILTQAEYDAIENPDSNVLYITDDETTA